MSAEIKKHQHTLRVIGYAVILFSVWDVAKTVIRYTLITPLNQMLNDSMEEIEVDDRVLYVILVVAMIAIILIFSMLLRLYVGRIAIAVGKGEDRRCGLMVFFTLLLIAISAFGVYSTFTTTFLEEDLFDATVELLVGLTSLITLIQLLIALYKVKQLESKAGECHAD